MLTEKDIALDPDRYIETTLYGNCPRVTIGLWATIMLSKLADMLRVEKGHLPMFPTDDSVEYDCDGWYNFYVSLNGLTDTLLDDHIGVIVNSDSAEDDYCEYEIPITVEEQIMIYNEINKELKRWCETSCEELLEQARLDIIALKEYEAKHDGTAKIELETMLNWKLWRCEYV